MLDKEFEIIYKKDLPRPRGPSMEKKRSIKKNKKDVFKIEKIERTRNNKWIFGYYIKKIQHGVYSKLEPIMVKFPKDSKINKITFKCSFIHDEPGITKNQYLYIVLKN